MYRTLQLHVCRTPILACIDGGKDRHFYMYQIKYIYRYTMDATIVYTYICIVEMINSVHATQKKRSD